MDLDRGQRAVALGAELHACRHLMARRRGGELFLARVLPFDRPTRRQRGEDAQILGDHLLLAAEAAADAFGEHVNVANGQGEQVTELLLHDERCLRTGAHLNAAVRIAPGDRAVRLQMHVLHARRRVGRFVHDVGLGEAVRDAADLAVDVDVDVAAGAEPLVVQQWRVRLHRLDRIEHRGQRLVGRRRAAGTPSRRSPPIPRPPPRHADRRSAPRCRACRCRPDRPDGPHAWRCCRGGAVRPPR